MIEVNDALLECAESYARSGPQGADAWGGDVCLLLDAVARRWGFSGSLALAVIGGVWLMLSYRSFKGSRIAPFRALIAREFF